MRMTNFSGKNAIGLVVNRLKLKVDKNIVQYTLGTNCIYLEAVLHLTAKETLVSVLTKYCSLIQ